MERQVLAAAREYHELMKRPPSRRGDTGALAALLEDDYTGTSRDGATVDKAQALGEYQTSQVTIESSSCPTRRCSPSTTAPSSKPDNPERGNQAGSRFDETTRYTTTWVLRGRWQNPGRPLLHASDRRSRRPALPSSIDRS
jgi:hypothetical protein